MNSPSSPIITSLLDDLQAGIAQVFGEQLVGLYVYGSLALGGFDAAVSDIDLLAALTHDVTDDHLDALRAFHGGFVHDHGAWDDRIEVAYVSVAALASFKDRSSRIAVISPGAPLHFVEAGPDWLVEWYLVRESDLPLLGPSPRDLIPPVSKQEFLGAIRVYAHEVAARAVQARDRRTQAYVVLTMCRALYAHQVGEHAAKGDAALWAQRELPEWGGLIREALEWRRASPANDEGSIAINEEIVRFAALVDARCHGQR